MATDKSKICKSHLKRFPKTPLLTLAKKIYSEHPLVFNSVENARHILRYYTGKAGNKDRKNLTDRSHIQELSYNYSPFENIPDSFEETREPCNEGESCSSSKDP